MWITLFSNHVCERLVASEFTEVGLLRASIAPPIIVIVSGVSSPRLASSEIATSTGTVGWYTEITCRLRAPMWRMKSWMYST